MGARCNGRAHILITRRSRGAGPRVLSFRGTCAGGETRNNASERTTRAAADQRTPGPPPSPHHTRRPCSRRRRVHRRRLRSLHGRGGFGCGGDGDDDDRDRDGDDDGATNGRAQTVRPPRPPRRLLRRFIRIKQ